MSLDQVNLSSAARGNLQALQSTNTLLSATENSLSTGKSVNSALDNAAAYFSSQGFLNRASSLSSIKDSLGTTLQTVTEASNAITSVTKLINQAQGLTTSALQTTDSGTRSSLATQFNALLSQINGLVNDSTFNGTNLIGSTTTSLVAYFNETNTTSLTISSVNLTVDTSGGLSVSTAGNAFISDSDINTAVSQLQTALNLLTATSSGFGNNVTVIQTRADFTSDLINTLQTASDNLVNADPNQETANLNTLQNQLQFGVGALGATFSAQQAILKLI